MMLHVKFHVKFYNILDLNFEIASRIKEEIRIALVPKQLASFARQIAAGMKHVSGLSIVHRDLAAKNILLGEDKVLKISDFGLSREGTYIKRSNGKIPFRWLSIEAIRERTYSTASDVWAFGVVLWEICTLGDTPYSSVADRDLKDFLLAGKTLEKVDSCADDIYEIMLKCWSHLRKDRPTFTELSDKLWNLEHEEKTYVNLDSLMRQSVQRE
ncbi:tyrosine kinase, partial [Paramuricea clavata]